MSDYDTDDYEYDDDEQRWWRMKVMMTMIMHYDDWIVEGRGKIKFGSPALNGDIKLLSLFYSICKTDKITMTD